MQIESIENHKDEFQEYFNTVISENDWNDKSILCLNENFLDDYIENIQLGYMSHFPPLWRLSILKGKK